MSNETLNMNPWLFDCNLNWEKSVNTDADEWLTKWKLAQSFKSASLFVAVLPFYNQFKLACLCFLDGEQLQYLYFLFDDEKRYQMLDGQSDSIHQVNQWDGLNITEETVLCYLRFFCSYVHGDNGPFLPIEGEHNFLPKSSNNSNKAESARALIKEVIFPGRVIEAEENAFKLTMPVLYNDALFSAQFTVQSNTGHIGMDDDEVLVDNIPDDVLALSPKQIQIHELLDDFDRNMSSQVYHSSGGASRNKIKLRSDREITDAYVMVLLRHALENNPDYDVLTDFNKEARESDAICDFASYVLKRGPVVVIESDYSYVEEIIAVIIAKKAKHSTPLLERLKPDNGGNIYLRANEATIFVLSTEDLANGQGGTRNFQRYAFDMSMSKYPILIGTDSIESLNVAIQNNTEFELVMPKLNNELFKVIFSKVFHGALPKDWQIEGTEWLRYLSPHDFHQPSKAGLGGQEAFNYLRERVKERLKSIDAGDSPSLEDLHGMGEAKLIAQDLIEDIQSAIQGNLPWSAVDRGMLLAGPPGTGKTTMARAIAKDCNVHFIAVNAATWSSAGNLAEHLRAMRSSFADARRYSPSILFIDEIDSFPNRDKTRGDNNSVYFNEVVNALLAEIQGFNQQKPVFVIGATNFPDSVDPALRRAGRLDKLVYIPRPNVPAIARIYRHYLSSETLVGEVDEDINIDFLANLSFGVTGADIESFVRGAARRARKAQTPLSQQHLSDEITGKSRTGQGSIRLTPEEMYRVAVHEAGHAVMRVLTGEAIAFVSIVPRDNGALGFVANMQDTTVMPTRKAYIDYLKVALAGRAAEELVFGKDNISSAAGGPSKNSDFALATQTATDLVCNMGMSQPAKFTWSDKPTVEQYVEIEKLLQDAYHAAHQALAEHRDSLNHLTQALLDKQELLGGEVLKLIKT